jgi:hypothetical protein
VQYEVTVPAGAELARFDLDAADDAADLDLYVYQLDEAGDPLYLWQAATAAADEKIDIFAPDAAAYLVEVRVFSANPSTAWNLVVTPVATAGGAPLTLDPPVIAGEQGVVSTYTAAWADLEPLSTYVGLVRYGDTGAATIVEVTTGEAPEPEAPATVTPPSITGSAEVGGRLRADPGEWTPEGVSFAFQWQADGADIPGATRQRYRVTEQDQGSVLTVVVTATSPEGVSASATSAGVTVKSASTTWLSLDRFLTLSWWPVTATVTVAGSEAVPPTGTVTLQIDGRRTVEVPLTAADDGVVRYELPRLAPGRHSVRATYSGDAANTGSTSWPDYVWVLF